MFNTCIFLKDVLLTQPSSEKGIPPNKGSFDGSFEDFVNMNIEHDKLKSSSSPMKRGKSLPYAYRPTPMDLSNFKRIENKTSLNKFSETFRMGRNNKSTKGDKVALFGVDTVGDCIDVARSISMTLSSVMETQLTNSGD